MTVTQDELIKQIADIEDANVATVRSIFKTAENIIFDHLSSTTPSETLIIKPFSGFTIERKYVPEKTYTKGMFQNLICPEHIRVKANSSKYYSEKINDELFS